MKNEVALAAKAIKTELKTLFPKIKFSVKSDTFSMGDAVRISYTDGDAKASEVEKAVKKYQYGTFNGMEDIYESNNVNNSIPQTKYITVSRNMSEAVKLEIAARLGIADVDGMDAYGEYYSAIIWRYFCKNF